MEHRKHSSKEIDNLIDNVYWNWRYTHEDDLFPDVATSLHYVPIDVWVVITLKNGYKLGDNARCGEHCKFEVIENLVDELKRKLMYTLDYISYMLLHKGISLIKTEDLMRLKEAKAMYDISVETGKVFK